MSADNGIYIARFPTQSGGFEYRVAEAGAIENCEDGSLDMAEHYQVLYFGSAPVFSTEKEASRFAEDFEEGYGYTEYGICHLEFDKPLLDITPEAALAWITSKGWREDHGSQT